MATNREKVERRRKLLNLPVDSAEFLTVYAAKKNLTEADVVDGLLRKEFADKTISSTLSAVAVAS